MQLRHLRYFVRAAERSDFTRASESPYIPQPALSLAIQQPDREQHLKGSWLTEERIRLLASSLFPGSSGVEDARVHVVGEMGLVLKQQITLLSANDGFKLNALSAVALVLLAYAPLLVWRSKEAKA